MNRAQTYRARLGVQIARRGEAFDLTQGMATLPLVGVFGTAGPDTVAAFFDPATAAGLTRPVLTLTLDGGAAMPQVGDTLTRDGRSLTVRAVAIRRVSGTPVALFALLD